MIFLPSSVPSIILDVLHGSLQCQIWRSERALPLQRTFFNDTVDFIFRKLTWNLTTFFRRNVRSGYWLHICSLRLSGCSCRVDLDTDTGSVLMNSFCQLEQTWKKSMVDRCLTIYVYNAYYIKE